MPISNYKIHWWGANLNKKTQDMTIIKKTQLIVNSNTMKRKGIVR